MNKIVKYTSSKWFVNINGEWIEIDEKDYERLIQIGADNLVWWQPTPDTEYQLDNVGFEIDGGYCDLCLEFSKQGCGLNEKCSYKEKVAHLKVEHTKEQLSEMEAFNKLKAMMVKTFKKYGEKKVLANGHKIWDGNSLADAVETNSEEGLSRMIAIINLSANLLSRDKIHLDKQEQSEVERPKQQLCEIKDCKSNGGTQNCIGEGCKWLVTDLELRLYGYISKEKHRKEVERLREEITEKNLELGPLRVEVEKLKDALMEFYTPEMPDLMLELLKSRL